MATLDLKLDANGDLAVENGDLVLISEDDLVRQKLQVALRTFQGEWVFNVNAGVPYFQSIIDGNKVDDLGAIDALLKAAILAVEGVNSILVYESSLAVAPRLLTVSFKVDSVFGPVEIEGITL